MRPLVCACALFIGLANVARACITPTNTRAPFKWQNRAMPIRIVCGPSSVEEFIATIALRLIQDKLGYETEMKKVNDTGLAVRSLGPAVHAVIAAPEEHRAELPEDAVEVSATGISSRVGVYVDASSRDALAQAGVFVDHWSAFRNPLTTSRFPRCGPLHSEVSQLANSGAGWYSPMHCVDLAACAYIVGCETDVSAAVLTSHLANRLGLNLTVALPAREARTKFLANRLNLPFSNSSNHDDTHFVPNATHHAPQLPTLWVGRSPQPFAIASNAARISFPSPTQLCAGPLQGCDFATSSLVTTAWKQLEGLTVGVVPALRSMQFSDLEVRKAMAAHPTNMAHAACHWLLEHEATWTQWVNVLPECTIAHTFPVSTTCDGGRTITFEWAAPVPGNPLRSTECSGGISLPEPLKEKCDVVERREPVGILLQVYFVLMAVFLSIPCAYSVRGLLVLRRERGTVRGPSPTGEAQPRSVAESIAWTPKSRVHPMNVPKTTWQSQAAKAVSDAKAAQGEEITTSDTESRPMRKAPPSRRRQGGRIQRTHAPGDEGMANHDKPTASLSRSRTGVSQHMQATSWVPSTWTGVLPCLRAGRALLPNGRAISDSHALSIIVSVTAVIGSMLCATVGIAASTTGSCIARRATAVFHTLWYAALVWHAREAALRSAKKEMMLFKRLQRRNNARVEGQRAAETQMTRLDHTSEAEAGEMASDATSKLPQTLTPLKEPASESSLRAWGTWFFVAACLVPVLHITNAVRSPPSPSNNVIVNTDGVEIPFRVCKADDGDALGIPLFLVGTAFHIFSVAGVVYLSRYAYNHASPTLPGRQSRGKSDPSVRALTAASVIAVLSVVFDGIMALVLAFTETPIHDRVLIGYAALVISIVCLGTILYTIPVWSSLVVQSAKIKPQAASAVDKFQESNENEISLLDVEFTDYVGFGSFGKVYRARYRGTDVAVKSLTSVEDTSLVSFTREIKMMSSLRHPNIIMLVGYSFHPPTIVMEFAHNGSLYELLHTHQRQLHRNLRLRMLLDAARGMLFLHEHNPAIIHMDVKSANLLVTGGWNIKVADFGISALKLRRREATGAYDANHFVGSVQGWTMFDAETAPTSAAPPSLSVAADSTVPFPDDSAPSTQNGGSFPTQRAHGSQRRPSSQRRSRRGKGPDPLTLAIQRARVNTSGPKAHSVRSRRSVAVKKGSRAPTAATSRLPRFAQGAQIGSVLWTAPEVYSHDGPSSWRSDVYSFGVVMFECIFQRVPYADQHTDAIPLMVARGKRPFDVVQRKDGTVMSWEALCGTSTMLPNKRWRGLLKLMRECLSPNPRRRPKFSHVVAELESIGTKAVGSVDWEMKHVPVPSAGSVRSAAPRQHSRSHGNREFGSGLTSETKPSDASSTLAMEQPAILAPQISPPTALPKTPKDEGEVRTPTGVPKSPGAGTPSPAGSIADPKFAETSGEAARLAQKRLGTMAVDPFTIQEDDLTFGPELARGKYGTVFEGRYSGTAVAIKFLGHGGLTGEMREEFMKECNLMLQLRHPNLVLLIGTVATPKKLLLVTELMEKGSLHTMYHEDPPPKTDAGMARFAVRVGGDVARGMAYLHSRSPPIVHRDLKSPNVMISEHDVAKVGDFGLSRAVSTARTMTRVGSPLWAAPEVLRGERFGSSCDVYSYAVILIEALGWAEPFQHLSAIDVMRGVAYENLVPDIPHRCPPTLANVIRRCMLPAPLRPTFLQLAKIMEEFDIALESVLTEGQLRSVQVERDPDHLTSPLAAPTPTASSSLPGATQGPSSASTSRPGSQKRQPYSGVLAFDTGDNVEAPSVESETRAVASAELPCELPGQPLPGPIRLKPLPNRGPSGPRAGNTEAAAAVEGSIAGSLNAASSADESTLSTPMNRHLATRTPRRWDGEGKLADSEGSVSEANPPRDTDLSSSERGLNSTSSVPQPVCDTIPEPRTAGPPASGEVSDGE